ncbi:dephospho-CoA kinase [Paludibacterium paludis]|uniref:Dephospho-CoA kinase n=1 Tax=Paludibacterium paludis TaxID=1225769 RepID=A0A918NZK6_9NEIS|nr:dephospho-CoA kinase [Paludibacterium paludis]
MIPVIGLTGGIGSGKSAAAACFADLGVPVVDTDVIAHRLTAPGGEAIAPIREAFGNEVIEPSGAMNRAAMRARVFGHPSERTRLEGILHPMIYLHSVAELAAQSGQYAILVVPLLFENQRYRDLVSRTLLIDCSESVQIERVRTRSGLSEESVRAIMAAQMPRASRKSLADDIIDNNGSLDDLRLQVDAKHRYYLANADKVPVKP